MSLRVGPQDFEMDSPEEHSQVEPADSQDISLFSEDAGSSLEPPSSPSISSFTTSSCSQSVLKNINPIVSSDPKVVEQISVSNTPSNSNVGGPIVAHGNDMSDNNSKSNVSSSKGASGINSSSLIKGAKAALNKLSQIGSSNSQISNSQIPNSQSPNSQIPISQCSASPTSQIVHDPLSVVSDSDSSDSSFKPPLPPRPRRDPQGSQSVKPPQSPQRVRSRSPLAGSSSGAHKGLPQSSPTRPSRRS